MDNELISTDSMRLHTQSVAGLATQLGYEGDLTVGSLEDGIRLYQRRTIEDLFELGKRLLLLKEQCQHGEFQNRVELLGFDPSLARRLMTATLKFAKQETSPVLKTVKTQSKLLELIVLDDEEIKVISEGGSIGDISLDTIETMSVRDLKKALREAKAAVESKDQDIKAKDLIIQKKDQKANELDEKLTKLNSPAEIKKRAESEPQRLAEKALEEMNKACITMHNDTVRFTNNINSIVDAINEHELYDIQERLEANVVALFQQIAQTSVELGIQIDFQAMVNPSWMSITPATESEAE
jgi:flagellar biosynthesis GTPase FlhF